MAQGIDKAASLDRLAQSLGIKQEEVMAFGDGFNDLSMIEYAGLGVAMENAVEGVKQRANVITKSNDEDGIAYIYHKNLKELNINVTTRSAMLLSYVNMKLRDQYASLDDLCDDLDISKEEIVEKLKSIDYIYDLKKISSNKF